MAKLGKTNAGAVPESVPHLKSRGMKNPMPASLPLNSSGKPEWSMGNDGPGKKASPPASGKKAPGEM